MEATHPFTSLSEDQRRPILTKIFSFGRPSSLRLVNREFCDLIDDLEMDLELVKQDTEEELGQYYNFKETLLAQKVTQKTVTDQLREDLHKYSNGVLSLRKGRKKGSDFNGTVFDFPKQFWPLFDSVLIRDTGKTVPFLEIAQNYEDIDYIKDLRQKAINGQNVWFTNKFTGDSIAIHRTLLSLFPEDFREESKEDVSEIEFLSHNEDLTPNKIDFTNKAALLKRQREILEEIESNRRAKENTFNPFRLLMKGPASWFIILCSGGNFAIAHYKQDELISHKSDKKYVQRKKAGKR